MAEEITTLGIKVETGSVKQGAEALDKLAQAGERAEKSTDSLSDSAAKANAQIAAMAQKAQGAGNAFKPLDPASASMSKIATEAQKASASLSGMGGKSSAFEQIAKSSGDAANSIGKASQKLKEFDSEAKKAKDSAGGIGSSMSELGRLASGLFAGVTVASFAGKLVSVQREFDVLNSSLVTITGSSQAAEKELAWIKAFAAETPFSLNEVTKAFIKMRSLGLDASKESLTSYGNTASAMGKSLDQMIEAVADASTGEFERLKEFGIKAKKSGDEVSLTFQGVTKTIKNNADEISNYLTEIGNKNFFGAMAERAKTLDGAISNLGDTWDELFRTINQNNAGSIIYDSVKLATGALTDAIAIIRQMNEATGDGARETGAFTSAQNGLATVFETVAILGMNVKYVLVQIGNEIGGIAAQAAAVARLDFRQAASIGQMMREDAAKARADLDAAERRVLNRNKFKAGDLDALSSEGLPSEPQRRTSPASSGTETKTKRARSVVAQASEEAKAYEQAMQSFARIASDAEKSTLGLTASQRQLHDLMASPLWQSMPESWRLTAMAEYEAARAAEESAEKFAKKAKTMEEGRRLTESMRTPYEDLGARIARLNELLDAGAIDWETYSRAVFEAQDALDKTNEKVKETSNEMDEYTKSAARNIQSSLADFLFDPFDKGLDGMLDSFGRTLQRMAADAAAAQISRALFGDMFSGTKSSGSSGNNGWVGQAANWVSSFDWGSLISAFGFHGGGVVGAGDHSFTRKVPASLFNNAPRYHSGGIVGDEVPAILKKGERVLTKEQQKMQQMGNVTINISSQSGDPAEIRRSAAAGARSALGVMSGAKRYG